MGKDRPERHSEAEPHSDEAQVPHGARGALGAVHGGTAAMPFVYLVRCRDGTLYAGAAVELARRLAEHHAGRASRYTRSRLPVELVWWREAATWSAALREEAALKRLKRAAKEALVRAGGETSGAGASIAGAAGTASAEAPRAAPAALTEDPPP